MTQLGFRFALLAHALVLGQLCVACTAQNAPPSPATAAPVEKAVRDLIGGYATAGDGASARAALETAGSRAFIDALKGKAKACTDAAAQGTAPADCERDPVLCAADGATLTAVVVTAVTGPNATAEATLSAAGTTPWVAHVSVVDEDAQWKVASIACP